MRRASRRSCGRRRPAAPARGGAVRAPDREPAGSRRCALARADLPAPAAAAQACARAAARAAAPAPRASTPAGSNPRRRRRPRCGGTGTTALDPAQRRRQARRELRRHQLARRAARRGTSAPARVARDAVVGERRPRQRERRARRRAALAAAMARQAAARAARPAQPGQGATAVGAQQRPGSAERPAAGRAGGGARRASSSWSARTHVQLARRGAHVRGAARQICTRFATFERRQVRGWECRPRRLHRAVDNSGSARVIHRSSETGASRATPHLPTQPPLTFGGVTIDRRGRRSRRARRRLVHLRPDRADRARGLRLRLHAALAHRRTPRAATAPPRAGGSCCGGPGSPRCSSR